MHKSPSDAPAPFRAGLGIGPKLIIMQVVVLALVVPSLAGVMIVRQQEALRAELRARVEQTKSAMRSKATALARNLAVVAGNAVAGLDFGFLKQVIAATASGDPELEAVEVIDDQGNTVVHSDPSRVGHKAAERAQVKDIEAREAEREGRRTLEVLAPVRDGARPFGVLRLSFSLRSVDEDVASSTARIAAQAGQAWRTSVLITVALAALGVLLAILFSMRIRRPVRTLVRAAQDVAAGNVERRVEIPARDEIGELSHNFNFLAERIQKLLQAAREHAAVENELEVARRIQRMLLPASDLQDLGFLSFSGSVVSASQCSGDFWYWSQLQDGALLVVIGDVEGHGVPAAIFSATARGYLDTLPALRASTSVANLLADLNRAIYGAGRGQVFMTCLAMIFDPARGEVQFANAGNVLPYVFRRPGGVPTFQALHARGDLLGSSPSLRYEAHTQRLEPGDLFLLYTDGLVEAQADGKLFGDRRLRRAVARHADRSADEILREVIRETELFLGGKNPEDDITFVALRFGEATAAAPSAAAS